MTGKQLKNAILQLAIQGKLVPQDPSDEPASVLLAKIRKEKEQLLKAGKLKKKDLETTPITDEEKPFDIPESWEWVRLSTIVSILGDGIHGTPQYDSEGKYYFVNGNNLNNGKIVIKPETKRCTVKEFEKYKKPLNDHSMLVSINGTIGNYAFYNEEPVFLGKSACFFNLIMVEFKDYMKYFIQSKYFLDYALESATGSTIKNVSLKVMNNLVLPLPPLAEQRRIVAKIEELMPLVEEYGAAQEKLNQLNEALPEALKKSILQQAIQGKLVPQDPSDEPASVLLAQIRKEKEQLLKTGKLKKKDLETTPISDEEKPFEIPKGWEWCRLGELVSNRAGLAYNKGDLDKKSDSMIRVLRGGNIYYGKWSTDVNDVMISSEFVNKDLLLRKGTFITPAVTSLENMGKTALIENDLDDTVVGGFVLMLQAYYKDEVLLQYLLQFFNTAHYKECCKSITNKSGQAFYNISRKKMMDIPIPLPPLAEQHRIVAKIEELMAMVDGMK